MGGHLSLHFTCGSSLAIMSCAGRPGRGAGGGLRACQTRQCGSNHEAGWAGRSKDAACLMRGAPAHPPPSQQPQDSQALSTTAQATHQPTHPPLAQGTAPAAARCCPPLPRCRCRPPPLHPGWQHPGTRPRPLPSRPAQTCSTRPCWTRTAAAASRGGKGEGKRGLSGPSTI